MQFVYKSSCPELPFVRVIAYYKSGEDYFDVGSSIVRDHIPKFIHFNARYYLSAPIPGNIYTVELKPSQQDHLKLVVYRKADWISSEFPCFSRPSKNQGYSAYVDANYTRERQMQLHVDDLIDESVNISWITRVARSRFG